MEQVFAEQAVLDPAFEILVGGRNDADVGLDRRMPADAIEMPVGQDAQQAGLQFGRHVADFVEEQRTALGLLETPTSLRLGAGERAALVAEQFGFEQILGNRRGVDGDERPFGTRTVPMQRTRHQFLARTGFAGDQHGGVREGETANGPEDFLHGRRLAENLRHQALFLSRTTLVHRLVDGATDQFERLINVERLGQVFERAALEGRNGAFQVRVGGHDDHRHRRMTRLHFLQQLQAGLAGHADIGHQHLRRFATAFQAADRLAGRSEALERDAFPRQRFLQHPAYRAVVVNNPYRFHVLLPLVSRCPATSSKTQADSTGRRRVNTVSPGRLWQSMLP